MKTIKIKLFSIFMVLMFSLVLGGILLNSLFLESYYIHKNKKLLIDISNTIVEKYNNDKETAYAYMDDLASSDGVNIIISDNNSNIEYNSFDLKSSRVKKLMNDEVQQSISKNERAPSRKHVYYIKENENNNDKTKLMHVTDIDENNQLILTKYVKSIEDSVDIANEFFIIAGIIIVLAGSIFILFFSNKITKPIIEMSNVAENISNLEFDKVVHINSKDEIGTLAESINKISSKLNKSITDLKMDVERRKQLVRNISHELKTPIGIIKGYAEALKYGVASDKSKIDKYCSILVDECDRMDNLIKELLDYSMIEGGIVKLNITTFNSYEFILNVLARFNMVFEENNIAFDLNCLKDLNISADKELLEKALNNFITNALTHVKDDNIITVSSSIIESNIQINVFNTGDNIPEEELSKIWDVYYKIDKARTRQFGGHGIGLSLVKLIAQLHGGTCTAANVKNGVIFSIKIPISNCEK